MTRMQTTSKLASSACLKKSGSRTAIASSLSVKIHLAAPQLKCALPSLRIWSPPLWPWRSAPTLTVPPSQCWTCRTFKIAWQTLLEATWLSTTRAGWCARTHDAVSDQKLSATNCTRTSRCAGSATKVSPSERSVLKICLGTLINFRISVLGTWSAPADLLLQIYFQPWQIPKSEA